MADSIRLKDYIDRLRVEIEEAVLARPSAGVHFDVEAIEVELQTEARTEGKVGLAVRVLTGEVSAANTNVQTLRLKLRARVKGARTPSASDDNDSSSLTLGGTDERERGPRTPPSSDFL